METDLIAPIPELQDYIEKTLIEIKDAADETIDTSTNWQALDDYFYQLIQNSL